MYFNPDMHREIIKKSLTTEPLWATPKALCERMDGKLFLLKSAFLDILTNKKTVFPRDAWPKQIGVDRD